MADLTIEYLSVDILLCVVRITLYPLCVSEAGRIAPQCELNVICDVGRIHHMVSGCELVVDDNGEAERASFVSMAKEVDIIDWSIVRTHFLDSFLSEGHMEDDIGIDGETLLEVFGLCPPPLLPSVEITHFVRPRRNCMRSSGTSAYRSVRVARLSLLPPAAASSRIPLIIAVR